MWMIMLVPLRTPGFLSSPQPSNHCVQGIGASSPAWVMDPPLRGGNGDQLHPNHRSGSVFPKGAAPLWKGEGMPDKQSNNKWPLSRPFIMISYPLFPASPPLMKEMQKSVW